MLNKGNVFIPLIILVAVVGVGLASSKFYDQVTKSFSGANTLVESVQGIRTQRSRFQIFRKSPTPQPSKSPTKTPTPTKAPTLTPTLTPKPTSAPQSTQVPQANSKFLWGTYTGWNVSDVINFESKVGKKINLLATFVHWGNESEFPLDLANYAKANGKTMVIYWEAMDYNVTSPNDSRFSYDAILKGNWNSYITSFAKSVKDYGASVILIPFEEANGNWYPWSGNQNGNTPVKHIQTFRYLRSFF